MSEILQYSHPIDMLRYPKFNVIELEDFVEEMELDFSKTYKIGCYTLLFITEGHTKYVIDFKIYDLAEGDVLLLTPGQVFYCLTPNKIKGVLILFMENFLYSNIKQDFIDRHFNLWQRGKVSIGSEKRSIFNNLIDLIKSEMPFIKESPTIILQQLLSVLLFSLDREYYSVNKCEVLIAEKNLALKFKMLVQKNISVKNNVEFFCNNLKISKSTLQKATKLVFQKTPKDIIEEVLLLEAKRLLSTTELRIKEIGYSMGFTDPTNFTKFFKKGFGKTPDAFRKQKYRA